MNKRIATVLLIIAIASPGLVHGANEDACASWLCLPLGYVPSDCGDARKEMIKRITSIPPKSPLPTFASCSFDGQDHGMSFDGTVVSFWPHSTIIEPHDPCVPIINDKPGCVPYTVTVVKQDGVVIGEPYMRPLDTDSDLPGFTPSELDKIRCNTFAAGARQDPKLTDLYCTTLLLEE